MKLHERIAYLGHCVRSSVNSLPEIHPPGTPRIHVRELEGGVAIGAPLNNFVEYYRVGGVVHSRIYKLSELMHKFSELRESVSCNCVISSEFNASCNLSSEPGIGIRGERQCSKAE